jgi:cephalosporin-C deacetylase-like acetyl esterase
MFILGHSFIYAQTEETRQLNYLQELLRLQEQPSSHDSFVSHHDKTWLDWVQRTGELPPNFDAVPSIPFLPDPLIIDEGGKNIPIKTMAQWQDQREYFKQQVKHILSGTFPEPPGNLKVNVLEERMEGDVKVEMIELTFGEKDEVKITIEVFTPPGNGPFPVFMTQWNHRGWAQIAVRRGYKSLIYAGADAKDDTRKYLELYPEHDWTTLMTRAWGAHRVVDYLYTLDEVDKTKIAITGHSRNGKQSLLAAAFDNRITATISSSGGTGGEFPYRYTDERHSNEEIDFLVSRRTHWLHPRLRFYMGREHKMPIDQNSLMALIAPNALMLSSSIREGGGGDPWAIEQVYNSVQNVYEFLDAKDKFGVRFRDGGHGTSARDIESYMDWFDIQFGRKDLPWDNKLYYNYSFDRWKSLSGEKVDLNNFPAVSAKAHVLEKENGRKIRKTSGWEHKKADIKNKINWSLGDAPAGIRHDKIERLSGKEDYQSGLISRPRVKNGKEVNIAPYNAFGDYLWGSLYYPTDDDGEMVTRANGKMPVVIYLHKYSNTGYDSQLSPLFDDLLAKGIAVFAMDMIGFGTRIEDGTLFYERYPHWSKMGRMVKDTQAAIDALEDVEFIDNEKIFVAGHTLGGSVAIYTSALDDRIAGTAVVSSFTPLRDSNPNKNVEGIKAYSHLHGLLPRLGFFVGNEDKLPVDYPEILSTIAPRPLLIIAPKLDRHANFEKVTQGVGEVKSVYDLLNASGNLRFQTPDTFNEFDGSQQNEMVKWMEDMTSTESIKYRH